MLAYVVRRSRGWYEEFRGIGEVFQDHNGSVGMCASMFCPIELCGHAKTANRILKNLPNSSELLTLFRLRQVLLLADGICLSEPGAKFIVHVCKARQSKRVKMILWRECLNQGESRILEAAREDDMPVNPILFWSQLSE